MIERPILLDVPDALTGERVIVRRFRDEDAEPMFAAIEDSRDHIRRFLPWSEYHRDARDTLEFIRRTRSDWVVRANFGMGIFRLEGGDFLGGAGLHPRNWRIPSFEIGYWIRQSAEGQGYVSEAVRLQTRLAFDLLGARRVFILCETRNTRSRAVPERLGYSLEGILRNELVLHEGEPSDVAVYALIPEEYAQVKEGWWTPREIKGL
jgi:RimJ/RimL family protein N-acetyltransferase